MTQSERIIERLKTGEWLSPVQAAQELYIMRLAARVYDLRKEGYEIEERRVAGKTYSEYRLKPAKPIQMPPAFPQKPAPVEAAHINQSLFT